MGHAGKKIPPCLEEAPSQAIDKPAQNVITEYTCVFASEGLHAMRVSAAFQSLSNFLWSVLIPLSAPQTQPLHTAQVINNSIRAILFQLEGASVSARQDLGAEIWCQSTILCSAMHYFLLAHLLTHSAMSISAPILNTGQRWGMLSSSLPCRVKRIPASKNIILTRISLNSSLPVDVSDPHDAKSKTWQLVWPSQEGIPCFPPL